MIIDKGEQASIVALSYRDTKDLSLPQSVLAPTMSPLFTEASAAPSQRTGISEAPIPLSSITAASKAPSTAHPKRRKVKYARVYGYALDPIVINKRAFENGTAIEGQFGRTFAIYRDNFCNHCGIEYDDILSVRNPEQNMPPLYCIPAATNLSKRSRIPNQHVIDKVKEFLKVTEESKWYYIVRD